MTNRQVWPDDIQPVEDLIFEHVDSRYLKVIVARLAIVYAAMIACSFFILLGDTGADGIIIAAADILLVAAFAVNTALARKIWLFKGYALRNRDITYRSGIFFETTTTVPFGKIQQVSVRMNPVSRLFGLYYVDVINGSQDTMSRITIPGLTKERAEQLKSLLINNEECDDE